MKNRFSITILSTIALVAVMSMTVNFAMAEAENASNEEFVPNSPASNSDEVQFVEPTVTSNVDENPFVPTTDVTNHDEVSGTDNTGGSGGNGNGNGGNGGSSGGSSSSSGSSGGFYLTSGVSSGTLIAQSAFCPVASSYMRIGAMNDANDVTRLQSFLKAFEKMDVDVNGIFDEKTETAVKAFQTKYMKDVLGPWEASIPTGYVGVTTLKKINEIACGTTRALTEDELLTIKANKIRLAEGVELVAGPSITTADVQFTVATSSDDDQDNVAAVAKASILKRFWNFILSLFR